MEVQLRPFGGCRQQGSLETTIELESSFRRSDAQTYGCLHGPGVEEWRKVYVEFQALLNVIVGGSAETRAVCASSKGQNVSSAHLVSAYVERSFLALRTSLLRTFPGTGYSQGRSDTWPRERLADFC